MTYFAVENSDVRSLVSEAAQFLATGGFQDCWIAMLDTAFDHDRLPYGWGPGSAPLYQVGRLEALTSFSPMLWQLPTHNKSRLEEELTSLIRHASGRPMLSFLRSNLGAQALAQRLQSLLEIHSTDQQSFLLRLADTRVSPAIARAFCPEHWALLTRDIDCWVIVNRLAQLESLDLPAAVDPPSAVPEAIVLSDPELDTLLRLGEPDALTQSLYEGFPELLPTRQRADFYLSMLDVCTFARQHGIAAFPELVSLAVAAVTTNGKVLMNPGLAAWLEARAWPSGHFEDGLTEFMEMAE